MLGFLKHLLIPHESNNHRAKILHNSSIFIILVLFLFSSLFVYFLKNTRPDILGISYSISETELLALVNNVRQENGLAPLVLNDKLSDAARRKAADMFQKNYWSHFPPDGATSPWGFIRAAGYNYMYAGENLAKGFTDAGSIVNAWMGSSTHRENILSSRFKEVGFAISPGSLQNEETVLVVEMFGASSQSIASVPRIATAQESIQAEKVEIKSENSAKENQPLISPTLAPKIPTSVPQKTQIANNPKIDASITSRAASTVGLSILAFSFLADLMIIERKKIPRIVGHNLDHVILILMFLLFLILKTGGVII